MFDAAETDADFLEATRAAQAFSSKGKHAEALAAYQSILADETTDTRRPKAAVEKVASMK